MKIFGKCETGEEDISLNLYYQWVIFSLSGKPHLKPCAASASILPWRNTTSENIAFYLKVYLPHICEVREIIPFKNGFSNSYHALNYEKEKNIMQEKT